MTRRFFLFALVFICSLPTNLIALELLVYPQKAPIGGFNLSKGVAVIRETGEIKSLSSDGLCSIEVSPEYEQITVDVFVPGFQAAGGVFESMESVELPLFLQSFTGDEVVIDLGESAAMVLAARSVIKDAVKEVEEDQQTDILDPPPDAAASINPFFVIELIVGKNMSEILGLDNK